MAIELTGANWGLLGGLILIGLIVFALRSVLSPLIIVLIIIIVLPMFGISFLGLVNVGNAGAVGKARRPYPHCSCSCFRATRPRRP